AWCWETAYQSNGAPVCAFTVQRDQVTGANWFDDRIYYYYARWTGTIWQKRFIAHAGRPLYQSEDDYAGGICLDPNNANTIYISSNAQNPFDLSSTTTVPLRSSQRYELYRGTTSDGGLTFSWTQITTNSAVDNLRPYIPRGQSVTNPAVIWFRGTYNTYTSYTCEVVGLFPDPIPVPQPIELSIISPGISPVAMTNLNNQLKLKATLVDDGLPQPAGVLWTTVSGPGSVVFSDPTNLATAASFSTNGTYVLRVTADDTISSKFAEVTIVAGTLSAVNGTDATQALWLKLDESSGTVASDNSGNGNDGIVSGGSTFRPAGGVHAGAIEFDGVSGQIVVPDADSLDNTSAFTLAYWFLAKTFPADSAGLVCKRNAASDNNAYTMYLKNDQHIYVDIDTANNRFSSSSLYTTGRWYHVALTFDGTAPTASRAKFWIDGKLDTVATESSATIPNYASALRIGNTHPGAVNWLNGLVDDVRFYRRALDPGEILALSLTNIAPSVFVFSPAVTNRVSTTLNGFVMPGGTSPLTFLWSKIGGPGNAIFGSPASPTTSVTFDKAGNDVLEFSASDGQIEVAQNVSLAVAPNVNVFEDWAASVFPGQTNGLMIDAAADPDGDGLSNFAEFALNLNPNVKDTNAFQTGQPGLPVATIMNFAGTNFLTMQIQRPLGRFEVGYDVEVTENFQSWSGVAPPSSINNGDGTETVTYRDLLPANESPKRFLRLRLTNP
ncbi:MAG: LamG-like jellyroll fold domain-containing protein, partial [Verrucomicrobiota bacterium]